MNMIKQGNTMVPIGKRSFTGNFQVLLDHNNHDPKVKYDKKMAKKQLKAYLQGFPKYGVQVRRITGIGMDYFPTPQAWR